MATRLADLAKGKGSLPAAKLARLREWLEEDWESRDVDRDAIRLIGRLLESCERRIGDAGIKIRDRRTGLFSSGGWGPGFGPKGKTWATRQELAAHLKMLERGDRYHPRMRIPASWEAVQVMEFFEERGSRPARDLLREPQDVHES